jgi:LruC domain-containing protein
MVARLFFGGFILIAFCISGCNSSTEAPPINVSEMTIDNVVVPANFNYATSGEVEVTLTAPELFSGAVFQLFELNNGKSELLMANAAFETNGTFNGKYAINAGIDSIRVLSNYLGLINTVDLPITGKTVVFDYRPYYAEQKSGKMNDIVSLKSASAESFTYLASKYDANGIPNNLAKADVFTKTFYDDINASLPEYKPVPVNNPQYLADKETNVIITETADVWITFVTEGAGWRNALGFYTNKDKSLKIVFPNASLPGSGGALPAGSKVLLGRFDPGTIISWFLVSNGWNGSQVVTGSNGIQYSEPNLNREKDPKLKQHMVFLYDISRALMVMGFEDTPRDVSSCDNDFNDAIFYVTSNPVTAISTNNVSTIKAAKDADGDGVTDELDYYPNDPTKAFNNYAPTVASSGSVSYEDLWPSKGDYDFNDLVVDYTYNQIANSKNMITSIEAKYTIKNIGGSYKNGFAITLPVSPSVIKNVTGQLLNSGFVKLNANGTEANQDKSVIFVVENAISKKGTTIPIVINFSTPVSTKELGVPPFDPFLVVNGNRDNEVHLPDQAPTTLGRSALGSKDDTSNPGNGRYYKTSNNLPWAINLYTGFTPPAEKVTIDKVYPRFISWANSGGTKDLDWYK